MMSDFFGSFSIPHTHNVLFIPSNDQIFWVIFRRPTLPETGHHLWTLPNRNKIKKVLGTEMSSIGNGFAFCKTAQLSRLKVGFSGRKLHNGAKTSSVKWYVQLFVMVHT